MKYPVWMKGLALILAALALLSAAAGLFGGILALEHDFYTEGSLENWKKEHYEDYAYSLAISAASAYAQNELSDVPERVLEYCGGLVDYPEERASWYDLKPENWYYGIYDLNGNLLENSGQKGSGGVLLVCQCNGIYWVTAKSEEIEFNFHWEDPETGKSYYLQEASSPMYNVQIWFADDAFTEYGGIPAEFIAFCYEWKSFFVWMLAGGLLTYAGLLVYLCFAAGKKRTGAELLPAGLNRLPLDLYLAIAGFGCVLLVVLGANVLDEIRYVSEEPWRSVMVVLGIVCVYVAALLGTAFFFAIAAQTKGKTHFWWKNSIVGRLCKLIGRGIRFLWNSARKLVGMLPLIWQWLLTAALMVIVPILFIVFAAASYGFGEVFWVLLAAGAVFTDIGIVCYGAYSFGLLLKGAKQMAKGDLTSKVNNKYLYLTFDEFAGALNALADVAVVAAKEQMRSERMKTELITNVSHDIKTPLTSIINYVDLLKHAQTDDERQQYLEVLGRQSQQMKRLLEDLMEMSKASSGNLTVELGDLDAVEAVNQALGEYADRLENAGLTPVFRQPEQLTYIRADGRLTWRVLSNLLNNVVKYAMPGTRVYLELTRQEHWVTLSVKNISCEELNVSARELMERFVRGDASRNTEGSGLGLNIAQSLMDAQGGSLELQLDGDLFKVTLRFPAK